MQTMIWPLKLAAGDCVYTVFIRYSMQHTNPNGCYLRQNAIAQYNLYLRIRRIVNGIEKQLSRSIRNIDLVKETVIVIQNSE